MSPNLDPPYIARCAVLAMALEVSGTPKPGNIDRDHDYVDTKYEDFIAAAIGVFPVMEKACTGGGIGELILEASDECVKWQSGGNTHFGAYILLFPLIKAAMSGTDHLKENAIDIVRDTTVNDAVDFYKAFSKVAVRMKDSEDLDVRDDSSLEELRERGLTMYDIMEISSKNDMVAKEWVNGFARCFKAGRSILEKRKTGSLNDATVLTYLELLAEEPDTFIVKKYDLEKAHYTQRLAIDVMDRRMTLNELSNRLYMEKINPGSTADIIIAGLFIALLSGLKV
ncbi:triphosphoribosyl-dephospho-CoA synthase [Methanocella sp. CWC-04]|uniref:Triphosphoribosyl-dephospho-CoA synthase n=1 Tax=Methanooceanicella nereidis TaxID=2052831 RepID=A0AAP2W824_9EURY|nr:triphosphoribosyl-dephospho-CoA synthase [Methanocella sp. CWC-04]MCD1295646.1 triphosphoribosyl-dephospho-CoA synthase [Methanocella sp. CWC-04]